jgi:hypothetical protein
VKHILLLGAGFSRNWGGWLAAEALEYLLGCPEISPPLRQLLFKHKRGGGFEAALAELQDGAHRLARSSPSLLTKFQDAIARMFSVMDVAFADTSFEFNNSREYLVATFLTKFDAIFTLNQDLLLERHYLNDNVSLLSNGKWDGWSIPGMVRQDISQAPLNNPNLGLMIPSDPKEFTTPKRCQSYFKLHGSSNWYASSAQNLMVIGGNKQAHINRYPILKYNFEQFWQSLHRERARLMVIGYSFGDEHINRAITSAAQETELALFVVDLLGIDVMDANRRAQIYESGTLAKDLWPRVVGASRRPLSTTFREDRVEHSKLMSFFQ